MSIGFSKTPGSQTLDPTGPLTEASDSIERHFARELHDQVAQPLVELVLEIDRVRERSAAGEAVSDELSKLEESARQILRSARGMLIDLRGDTNLKLNFTQALKNELRSISTQGLAIEVSSRWPKQINGWAAFNLIRIVQQAVINASRHGRAAMISIFLDIAAGDEAVLVVLDDGIGIDRTPPGLGMIGMRERATILGGTLNVSSRETGGTRIEVRVPMHRLR